MQLDLLGSVGGDPSGNHILPNDDFGDCSKGLDEATLDLSCMSNKDGEVCFHSSVSTSPGSFQVTLTPSDKLSSTVPEKVGYCSCHCDPGVRSFYNQFIKVSPPKTSSNGNSVSCLRVEDERVHPHTSGAPNSRLLSSVGAIIDQLAFIFPSASLHGIVSKKGVYRSNEAFQRTKKETPILSHASCGESRDRKECDKFVNVVDNNSNIEDDTSDSGLSIVKWDNSINIVECALCNKPVPLYNDFDFFKTWLESSSLRSLTAESCNDSGSKLQSPPVQCKGAIERCRESDSTDVIESDNSGLNKDTKASLALDTFDNNRFPTCGILFTMNPKLIGEDMRCIVGVLSSVLLSTEDILLSIVEKITPSDSCRNNKVYLFRTMQKFLIHYLGEDTMVYLAGSTAYDIDIDYGDMLPSKSYSDLDIEVLSNKFGFNSRAILKKIYCELCNMQSIVRELNLCNNWVLGDSGIKLVESARVPIITIQTKSGIVCDISVNTANSLSHNELFRKYIGKHPVLRPFMRIIKHWLKFRGLPIMKEGGFPSILWMLLFCNIIDTDGKLGTVEDKVPNRSCLSISSLLEVLSIKQVVKGFVDDKCLQNVLKMPITEFTILASLEKCFRLLSLGNNLIEMVNIFSSLKGSFKDTDGVNTSKWKIGEICTDLMHLIDMEPNVPFGTWLVYYYELQRAERCIFLYARHLEQLISLLAFLRYLTICANVNNRISACWKFRDLAVNVKEVSGYDLWHVLKVDEDCSIQETLREYVNRVAFSLNLKLYGKRLMDSVKILIYHLLQRFRPVVLDIFEESNDCVYSIPAVIEPPTLILKDPVSTENTKNGNADDRTTWPLLPQMGKSGNVSENYLWSDSGWFMVMLQGKLSILKVMKACIDWDSWWSVDFVSRRDTRSVFHGFVYRQLNLDSDTQRHSNFAADNYGTSATARPSVLLRRGGLVLFHPCDIVSRLHVLKVMKQEQNISSYFYSFDIFTGVKSLYILPGFEVSRFNCLERIGRRLKRQIDIPDFGSGRYPHHCRHCGAITVNSVGVSNEQEVSQRKFKNLKFILCSQRYLEHYRIMEQGLKRLSGADEHRKADIYSRGTAAP